MFLCTVILFLHCWWFWVLQYHCCIVGIFSTVISLLVVFSIVVPLLHCWWIWVLRYHSCWLSLLIYHFYGYCSHHLEVNGVIRVQTTTSALADKKTYSGTQDARLTRQDWQVLRSGWLRGRVLDCGRSSTNSSSLAVTSPSLHSSLTTAAPAPSLPARDDRPIERRLQSFTVFRQWFDYLITVSNSTSVNTYSLKRR